MTTELSTDGARKHGLAPVGAREDARLLILGSLPGDASLAAAHYYAHPRNHFWLLLEAVLEEPLAALGYDDRLALLGRRGVALWDVVGSARRGGSLDGALREVEARDLGGFAATLPMLTAVAFNGATAARLGRRMLGEDAHALIDLPSSSPALTLKLADKAQRWAALKPYVIDGSARPRPKPKP